MVFHGFWLSPMVFKPVSWFLLGLHGFLRWCHFFLRFVVGFHGFPWFLVGFHGFSRWFHGFSWFLVGFYGF